MEAVMFIGIQATGKSSFYRANFHDTHVRINLDMLKTRHREKKLFECCMEIKQSFVLDNTNLSKKLRQNFIAPILENGIKLKGYYFSSQIEDALKRNSERSVQVPERGILSAYKKLELPSYEEGFSELYYVKLNDEGFIVSEWEK
ncbi:hypothetical protein KKF34_08995 [Myxococcota bacterium]|nr:hypothetical protein [Myxococcota bacterium]MBU1379830.1 hypothetical protein [Myxococcota bacterium]MBU1496998.1 hypothetical protein [Myxococcota bacterium]